MTTKNPMKLQTINACCAFDSISIEKTILLAWTCEILGIFWHVSVNINHFKNTWLLLMIICNVSRHMYIGVYDLGITECQKCIYVMKYLRFQQKNTNSTFKCILQRIYALFVSSNGIYACFTNKILWNVDQNGI